MSKLNVMIDIKGYEENKPSCRPNFSRNNQYIGVDLAEETVANKTIAAAGSEELLNVALADSKNFIYIEASGECDIIINGTLEGSITPVVIGNSTQNGVFLKTTSLETVTVQNNGAEAISIYYILA